MKTDKENYTSLTEPKRESVYDILQKNLKRADRRTFVHRCIMVGEHSFGVNWSWGVEEVFRALITDINEEYNDENITGVLICYPSFFCHLLEGCEDALIKFISMLFKKYDNQLGIVKFLAPFHHIYKRAIDKWVTIKGNPPRLIRKIEDDDDINTTSHHVLVCIKKLFKLCTFIKYHVESDRSNNTSLSKISSMFESQDTLGSFSNLPVGSQSSRISVATIGFGEGTGHTFETTKWRVLLPEHGVLTFILQSPFLNDVRDSLGILESIEPLDITEDLTWPIPLENVCEEAIYDQKLDPAMDLPMSKK